MDIEQRLAETKTILSKDRILVVEDVDNARSLYCGELQKKGYLVDGARNLDEALSRLEARTYHVAVVDIMLGGEHDRENRDGLTILNIIKGSRRGTRSIVLTGQDEPELAAELISQYGANDYIDKDKYIFAITDELINRVRRQVKECKISLYGEERVISFLAGPGNEVGWVDRSMRTLKIIEAYAGLERFFSALCDPIAPLVPQKKMQDPTMVDKEVRVVVGRFWSKALALPIMLVAGQGEMANEFLQSRKMPELQSDGLLVRYSEQELTGLIFELMYVTRSEFEPELS